MRCSCCGWQSAASMRARSAAGKSLPSLVCLCFWTSRRIFILIYIRHSVPPSSFSRFAASLGPAFCMEMNEAIRCLPFIWRSWNGGKRRREEKKIKMGVSLRRPRLHFLLALCIRQAMRLPAALAEDLGSLQHRQWAAGPCSPSWWPWVPASWLCGQQGAPR